MVLALEHGRILFQKNDRTRKLAEDWLTIHTSEKWKPDQPSFAKAVYENPELRLLTLDVSWNYQPKYHVMARYMNGHVKIDHYVDILNKPAVARRILEIDADIAARDDKETAARLCLTSEERRRYKLIASRLIDNPLMPSGRRLYNALKRSIGVNKPICFLHKHISWKS